MRAAPLILCLLTSVPLAAQATTESVPATPRPPAPGTERFYDRTNLFHVDLPTGWRQLAPGEVARVAAAVPDLPADVAHNEPTMFYAIGPVDRWLRGEFDGAYLYVVHQDNEWQLDDQFAGLLQTMWRDKGAHDGIGHEVTAIEQTKVGPERHPAVTCERRSQPLAAGRAQHSLDVYVPTGGRQISLAFVCDDKDFAARRADLRAMVDSLQFARRARGEQSLGDRLWSPLLVGGLVGLVLIVLYRTRRRV